MLLSINNLEIQFSSTRGPVYAIRDLSLNIQAGEFVGIVGESGSGKSVTSLAVMDLLPENAKIVSGKIDVADRKRTAMVFQDPMTSLNPSFTVEWQIFEALKIHQNTPKSLLREKAIHYLGQVGIPDPETRLNAYPHQLSGGLAQRVMIAMAMACDPVLLIADEPTTALDVTIQAQILSLLRKLQRENNLSVLLISHDMAVIAQNTQRMYVMYAGQVMEEGVTAEVISNPQHPYTKALLSCIPQMNRRSGESQEIPSIPGMVPSLLNRPVECVFRGRCQVQNEKCNHEIELKQNSLGRKLRCIL